MEHSLINKNNSSAAAADAAANRHQYLARTPYGKPQLRDDPYKFPLAQGYITYKRWRQGGLVNDKSQDSNPKRNFANSFLWYNRKLCRPIQLYSSQMLSLVEHLPEAFKACNASDTSYCAVITQNKVRRITLEVNLYKEKSYLFLKMCYKPAEKADDPKQDWIYTSSVVSLSPSQDDPSALVDFVFFCSE